MSLFRAQVIPVWVDPGGGEVAQFVSLLDNDPPPDSPAITLVESIQAMSDLGLHGCWVSRWYPVGSSPGTGAFNRSTDRAQFIFRSTGQKTIRVNVPGPKSAIFAPGTDIVDPLNPAVSDFIAAVLASCSDAAGNNVSSLVQAMRVRVRQQATDR